MRAKLDTLSRRAPSVLLTPAIQERTLPQVQLYLIYRNSNTLHKLEKKKWDIHSDSENIKEKPNKFYPSLERTTSLKEITQVVTTASKTRPRQKNMLAAQAKLNPWKKVDIY